MLPSDFSADLRHPVATGALARGDASAALVAIEHCDDAAGRRIAGRALALLGDTAGALRAWTSALNGAADDEAVALAHEGLATVARDCGELDRATKHLEAALLHAPLGAHRGLHREAAALARRRGDLDGAEYHASLVLAPGGPPPPTPADRVAYGAALSDLGRHDEAVRQLRTAVDELIGAHGPAAIDVVAAQTELAAALHAAGLLERSAAVYEGALTHRIAALGEHHPGLAPMMLALGTVEAQRGRADAARDWATRAVGVLRGRVPGDDPLLSEAIAAGER